MLLYKIKKSNIDNKGLVAAKDIKKGTKIIEYKGKLISKKESEENPKFDNSKRDLVIVQGPVKNEEDILDENFHKELIGFFLSIRPFFDYMSEILTTNLDGESII